MTHSRFKAATRSKVIILVLPLAVVSHAFDTGIPLAPAQSSPAAKTATPDSKPKFTKEQVNRRLAELKELLDRGLILREFYDRKVKECEASP